MTTRIKLRRDTAANWTTNNPILALGEAGHDTTTNELRIGDGSTAWTGLAAIGGAGNATSGNILLSQDESYQLTLSNNGYLLGGSDGYQDINIGQDSNNEAERAYILISQDNPYIRSEVLSTTSNNYRNEMVWHNPWYSRYSKVYTNAYGAHIQNAQWYGPGNDYFHRWSFTKDGVFNMPPAAVIRSNDYQSASWYDPIQGEDINDDQTPFAGTLDSSLTFDANSISIARGSLNMNGVSKAGWGPGGNWIAMAGSFGQNNVSTAQEGSCMDSDGNTYTLQVADDGDTYTAVTKWSAAGKRLWQRGLWVNDSAGGPTMSANPVNISWEPDSDNLFIALNDYSSAYDTPIFIEMDTDGNQVGPAYTMASTRRDIEVNDFVTGVGRSWADNAWAAVGRAANGHDYYTPNFDSVANYSINGGYKLVVNTASTFGEGLRPTLEGINNYDWYMFGPDLTGNVRIDTINTITNESAVRTAGSGTGTDAIFTISWRTSSPVAYVVSIAGGGTNYANDDVLVITGDKLGGTDPLNNLTLAITTEGGVITGVTPTGSPTLINTVLSLQGNPLVFSSFESWGSTRILSNNSTDALLITLDVFDRDNVPHAVTLGNVGWDTFNAVAFSTVSNNLYVGGRYHPLGNSGPRRSVLAKIHGNNSPLDFVWQVEVDDYTGRNEIRGIAVDSTDSIGVVAVNNDYDTVVTKVSGDGAMLWQRKIKRTFMAPSYDNDTYGIGVDALGNFIVTARATRDDDFDSNNEDLVIASFDTNGDLLWSRSLGTIQNDYSLWDRTFRNITVNNDTMVITGYSYAGGFRVTHPSNSVGFVAKLPTDGTGMGHYGEWRYLNLPLEIEVVSNTAANTATMTFTQSNDIDWDNNNYTYANLAVRSGGMALEFALPSITYQAGGPGEITGLNELVFTNGSRISNVNEEGLMLWQPSQGYNAEYIALAYGGNNAENANVVISAGTENWAIDDDNLQSVYYPDGLGQNQQQVNIDIKAEGGDADNISNWHFDENGSMYLPAQSGYFLDSQVPVVFDGLPGGVTKLVFEIASYPKVATLVQPGDFVIDQVNENLKGTVIAVSANASPTLWDITISTVLSESLTIPAVRFTNQQTNGIVFSDGSKQQTAGRKIIQGWPGQRNIARSAGTSYSQVETLIWTASSADVSAFRGTVRCQYNDSSVAMKIYEVVGASAKNGNLWDAGVWDMNVTSLIEMSAVADPGATTFRMDIDQADLIMRIYATAPADVAVYMTTDITEFKYTYD